MQLLYLRSLLERHNPLSLEGSIEDTAVYNPAFSGHKVLEYYVIRRFIQNDLFEVRHHSWKIWRKSLSVCCACLRMMARTSERLLSCAALVPLLYYFTVTAATREQCVDCAPKLYHRGFLSL
jgi:hypothetical protein